MNKVMRGINTWEGPAQAADMLEAFLNHLASGPRKIAELSARFDLSDARRNGKPLHKMWEASELSAQDFAEEVAGFFSLRRIGLSELMTASSLADRFSHRFLRESAVFP